MGVAKSIMLSIVTATCLFFALDFLAKRAALDYHLSSYVGRLDDPYGFQNLALPRLLRFFLTILPTALGAVAVYGWIRNAPIQFSLWTFLACITAVALLVALANGDPTESVNRPFKAAMVGVYMVVLGGLFAWVAMRQHLPTK